MLATHLQEQLRFAIQHNRDAKLNRADFPGYWLYVIEEQLDKADKRGILSNLHISEKDASAYKRVFTKMRIKP